MGVAKTLLELAVKATREAAPLAVRKEPKISVVRAPNAIDPQHLRSVVTTMQKLGPPTIRVVKHPTKGYAALEGSHRLAAAKKLGIKPNFEVVSPSSVTHSSQWPEDLTSEFWMSRFHDEQRDDSISPQDFMLPGDALARYAASNTGVSYTPKDFGLSPTYGKKLPSAK